MRNVMKIQENLTLQQFKVIQCHRSWCQWKAHKWLPRLLVIICNLAVFATVFEIFTLKDRKTADFSHLSLVWRPARKPLRISGSNLVRKN